MADANYSQIAFVKETTFGVTPGPGALQVARITGESLSHNKDTVQSEEIRGDRQISDLAKVGAMANGGVEFELSQSAYQWALLAAIGASGWTTINESLTSIDCDDSTGILTGAVGDFDDLPAGGYVKIAGFANAGNNGIKRVVSKAGDGSTLTLAAGSITTDETNKSITITGKDARNGIDKTFHTMERAILAPNGTTYYQVYRGMAIDELKLTVASKAIVKGSLSFMGQKGTTESASVGTSYTAAASGPILNGTSNVGQIYQGSALSTERFKSVEFSIKNNLRSKDAIGIEGAFEIGYGSLEVTGSLDAYFKDNVLYASLINHDYSGLSFVLTGADGKALGISFPYINFGKGDPNATGINTDIMVKPDFTAIMHPTLGCTVIINAFDS